MKVSGWGKFPSINTKVVTPNTEEALVRELESSKVIARGNGRAYGDSALNDKKIIIMNRFNHLISFDEKSGVLVAESGVLLADIIKTFLPRGWFPKVSPGTKFVTIGGMIASDIHGKNHHCDGCMHNTVEWFDLLVADGKVLRCSNGTNSRLFKWTFGAMGLTGIVLRAAIILQKVETGWIKERTITTKNLKQTMDLFELADGSKYSVAWVDCLAKGNHLGRAVVSMGEHARLTDLTYKEKRYCFGRRSTNSIALNFDLPNFLINRLSLTIFNKLYYWWCSKTKGSRLVNWNSFFYPLDAILGWNRIYGRRGFIQFQCVIPNNNAALGLETLLKEIRTNGSGSFLTVLKRFGTDSGVFSFPLAGFTLAVDLPVTKANLNLVKKLDLITLKYGGRFYLAKDARMHKDTFRASDTRVEKFLSVRDEDEANKKFVSLQSERLSI